jgi:hypothetical protein
VKTIIHRNVHAVQGGAIYPHLAVDEEKSMPEQERCQNTMVMHMGREMTMLVMHLTCYLKRKSSSLL